MSHTDNNKPDNRLVIGGFWLLFSFHLADRARLMPTPKLELMQMHPTGHLLLVPLDALNRSAASTRTTFGLIDGFN